MRFYDNVALQSIITSILLYIRVTIGNDQILVNVVRKKIMIVSYMLIFSTVTV
jgi:hypothetical protein